jgi:DNA-binding NarL/FixJ family response regulator
MPVADVVSAFTRHSIPVLVVSAMATQSALSAALGAGASGYVTKRSSTIDLERAVRAVLEGRPWVAPDLAGLALQGSTSVELSSQERRALVLYASGMTADMVARRMDIAPSTVKNYIDRVRSKYERAGIPARTKVELNAVARQEGLIP